MQMDYIMEKAINSNDSLFKDETHQKIIILADKLKLTPNILLNTLLDEEIERQRLLEIFKDPVSSKIQAEVPVQNIIKICNKHLANINHESESITFIKAIESLYRELLKLNLLSVNSRKKHIVESYGMRTEKVDYYWYAGVLAKNISMWFGTHSIYLFHPIICTNYEMIFIGMPNNVEVCNQLYLRFYKLFKKMKLQYKKDAGSRWGSRRDIEEEVGKYMSKFAQKIAYAQAFIENEDHNKHLYDYALEKYPWAMQ
jgi:hypothetical protein